MHRIGDRLCVTNLNDNSAALQFWFMAVRSVFDQVSGMILYSSPDNRSFCGVRTPRSLTNSTFLAVFQFPCATLWFVLLLSMLVPCLLR